MMRPSLLMSVIAVLCYAVLPVQAQVVRPDPSQPGGFPLPDGAAKPIIQQNCIGCHDLRRVVNNNKDADGVAGDRPHDEVGRCARSRMRRSIRSRTI